MSRVSRTFRIIGTVIKMILTAGVAFICGLLIWRVFFAQALPEELDGLKPNEALCEAYADHGEDLEIFTQDLITLTNADRNRGYFSAPSTYFIPEANQIQILFRYNNSTIRALQKDYGLSREELPARTERIYDVTLVLNIDRTPEDTSDNAKSNPESVRQVRLHATSEELTQKSLYNYVRLVYDLPEEENLKTLLEENLLLAVFGDVYYVNDLDYEKTTYGTMCLYDYLSEKIEVKLKRADQKALAAYTAQG